MLLFLPSFGLNVFISILLQHVSHITTCKFLGLERKHIAYLVLLSKFCENIFDNFEITEQTISTLKIMLEHNFVKICRWSYGSNSLPIMLYICTNIFQDFKIIEWT